MKHPIFKPTKKYDINFHPSELTKGIEIPESSKKTANEYLKSPILSDDFGMDLMIMFDNSVIFGYDYDYNGKKLILPELNPTIIFYSNAIMSYGRLNHYKKVLLTNSADANNLDKVVNFNHFGTFYQLAVNCIINLQATLESFLNHKIIGNFEFKDKKGKPRRPNIHEKMEIGIQTVTELNFHDENNFKMIKKLVRLRNDIIHLKPDQDLTNTKYKVSFRNILGFDYDQAIIAIKNYINFYEPNLIEDCSCGKEFCYDIFENKRGKKSLILWFKKLLKREI